MTAERNDRAYEGDEATAIPDEIEPTGEEEQAEVGEIRADIEETRLEMGSTLNELGDRLEPSHLMDQAKENVREATIGRVEETARGISDMVLDTIKRNPIPAALAGAGLAMLWKNREQGSDSRQAAYGTDYGYPARPGSMYAGPSRDDLGSKVSDAASTVTQGIGDRASAVAGSAQEAGSEIVNRASETAQQVGWKLDSFMQANPLAMGAIAVGAGAVIGSLLPETEQEREMLGDASRRVSSVVRETVEDATTKAEEGLDRVEEEVGSAS